MLIRNNLIAAKNQYLLFLALNIMISVSLMITLSGTYASYAANYSDKARLSEVLLGITTFRTRIMTDYYYLGHWPEAMTIQDSDNNYELVKKITFDGEGTINIFFNNRNPEFLNKTLSFTAANMPQSESSSMLWICGYAQPPEEFELIGENLTNISLEKLPNTCK